MKQFEIKGKICPIHFETDPTDIIQQNTKTLIYYISRIVTLSSSMEIKLLVPSKIVFTRNLLLNFSLIQIAYKKWFWRNPEVCLPFPVSIPLELHVCKYLTTHKQILRPYIPFSIIILAIGINNNVYPWQEILASCLPGTNPPDIPTAQSWTSSWVCERKKMSSLHFWYLDSLFYFLMGKGELSNGYI